MYLKSLKNSKQILKLIALILIGVMAACVPLASVLRLSERCGGAVILMQNFPVIVIDAGHGGIDGGAVAQDGTLEKDLNLSIAQKTERFFWLFGYETVMTRSDDRLISDERATTIRQKKSSDLHNRSKLLASYEDALLLSIHQNKFSQAKYSGTQVFYSGNHPSGQLLADCIQRSVVSALQSQNTREIKRSGSEIYLLHTAQHPAVMVECGFLSNQEELSKLKDSNYQSKIAFCILYGIIDFNREDQKNFL